MTETIAKLKDVPGQGASRNVTYWRVEGSLLEVGAMRLVGFFTWNAQSFSERWARRLGMAAMALSRPFAYAASRTFATRLLHTLLRGVSQDRLDLLGEEYFQYVLKPQLRREAVEKLLALYLLRLRMHVRKFSDRQAHHRAHRDGRFRLEKFAGDFSFICLERPVQTGFALVGGCRRGPCCRQEQ